MSAKNLRRVDINRRFLFIEALLTLWAIATVMIPIIICWDQIDRHFGLILAYRLSAYFTVLYGIGWWRERSLTSWLWRD